MTCSQPLGALRKQTCAQSPLRTEDVVLPPGKQRGPTGEADIHIVRELGQHGGGIGRPRSLSKAVFMDRAAAAANRWDSWALPKPTASELSTRSEVV